MIASRWRQFVRRAALACLVVSVVTALSPGGSKADTSGPGQAAGSDGAHPNRVEMFAAIEADQIAVALVPRNSRRLTLRIENKTDRPLAIELPRTFAAVPVLAQPNFFNNQNNNQNNQAPQGLGAGMPGMNQGNNMNVFGQGPFQNMQMQNMPIPRALQPNGLFNIGPEKTISLKVTCVCLNYGQPEPRARMPYEIKPLSEVTDDASVRELLERLGAGVNQRAAQAVAWHLTDGLSWQELQRLKTGSLPGWQPRFTRNELAAAKQLFSQLPSEKRKKSKSDRSDSLSRR